MNVQVKQESVYRNACLLIGGAWEPLWGENRLCCCCYWLPRDTGVHCSLTDSPVCLSYGCTLLLLGNFHLRAASIFHLFSLTFSSEPTNAPYPKGREKELPIYTYHSSSETLGMAVDFRIMFSFWGAFLPSSNVSLQFLLTHLVPDQVRVGRGWGPEILLPQPTCVLRWQKDRYPMGVATLFFPISELSDVLLRRMIS